MCQCGHTHYCRGEKYKTHQTPQVNHLSLSGLPAVCRYRSVSRAPLPLLDLSNQVNEPRASVRHPVLWPVCVLELFHWQRRPILHVHQFELPQGVVRVFGGVVEDHLQLSILISTTQGPVAVALDLFRKRQRFVMLKYSSTVSGHTLPPSLSLVSMTMVAHLCSQTSLQKSS